MLCTFPDVGKRAVASLPGPPPSPTHTRGSFGINLVSLVPGSQGGLAQLDLPGTFIPYPDYQDAVHTTLHTHTEREHQ